MGCTCWAVSWLWITCCFVTGVRDVVMAMLWRRRSDRRRQTWSRSTGISWTGSGSISSYCYSSGGERMDAHADQLTATEWSGGALPYHVGHKKLGMWLFIVSDALTFSALL